MTRLLVPIDGSDGALRALEHAIDQAGSRSGAFIHLVTAHEPLATYPEIGMVYVSNEKRVALQKAESEAILAAGETLLKEAGVPHSTEILTGPVGPTIAARARALGCDGIVMGTRGMGAAKNLVMGSVATKVVHAATVPVTLVK